jgi:hypothetical protein
LCLYMPARLILSEDYLTIKWIRILGFIGRNEGAYAFSLLFDGVNH